MGTERDGTADTVPATPGDRTLTAGGAAPAPTARHELPTIDPAVYDVGSEIAHGGMGRIRAARDLRLGREVAIKELLEPHGTLAVRFEREALVTARLQHPGIVAVYEAGRWPSGEPFYAMKRVHGRSLKKVIEEARTFDARLALLPHAGAVADAMAYAHEHGIVHRDLKPANVLVGEFGETVVIDWGLAKDLGAADGDSGAPGGPRSSDASLTRAGSVMGTPSYMPPEQARGETVDERADVYAIGAMLYHLLAGRPPYAGDDSTQVLAKVVGEPPAPLREHERRIAPDLLAIVERAMAREPAARYPTARELAEDLKKFLTGQLVASHRYTRGELVRRFVRRNRMALAITAVAALVVAIGAVLSIQSIRDERDQARSERVRADRERTTADHERAAAVERADQLTIERAVHELDRDPHAALVALEALSHDTKQLAAAHVVAAEAFGRHAAAVRAGMFAGVIDSAVSDDGALLAVAMNDRTVRVLAIDSEAAPRVVATLADEPQRVAFGHGRRVLVAASNSGTLTVVDLASGQVTRVATGKTSPSQLAVTADGSRVFAVTFTDARLRSWDAKTGTLVFEAPGAKWIQLSPDDRALSWGYGEDVIVRDLATGRDRTIAVGKHTDSALSANGAALALAREDGSIAVVDVASGRSHTLGKQGKTALRGIAISRDGKTVYALSSDRQLRAWTVDGAASVRIGLHLHDVGARLVAAPDGKTLLAIESSNERNLAFGFASGSDLAIPATTWLWDLETGDATALDGPQQVTEWAFAAGGASVIAIAGRDLWTWRARTDARAFARQAGAIHQVLFLGDGRVLAASDRRITIEGDDWLTLPSQLIGRLAFDADRARAAMLGDDGRVRVIDMKTREIRMLDGTLPAARRAMPSDPPAMHVERDATGKESKWWTIRRFVRAQRDANGWFEPVTFSPDGTTIAAAGTTGGKLHVWALATGARRDYDAGSEDIEQLAFSPDAQTLVAACADGRIHVISLAAGSERVLTTSEPIESIAITPDGRMLFTGGVDRVVRAWNLASGDSIVRDTHGDVVTAVALSRDGHWLVSAAQDKSLHGHDLVGGHSFELAGLPGKVLALAFSTDGQTLVTADDAGSIRALDLGSAQSRTLRARGDSIGDVAISPDGRHIAAAGADGIVREWTDEVPVDERGLRAWIERATR